MRSANWTDGEYLNAALMNLASQDSSGTTIEAAGVWAQPGLVRPDVLTWSASGLSLTVVAPPPFVVRFASGITAGAHGTTTGSDTQSSTVSFSTLVPASGPPITAYVVASLSNIQQTLIPITGPPPSNPAFNPNFVAFTAYAENVTSLNFLATTSVPDGINYIEVARTTLTSGQSSISLGNLIYSYQQLAGNVATLQSLSISGSVVLGPTAAGILQLVVASGLTVTLPPASNNNGLSFYIGGSGYAGVSTIAAAGADQIFGSATSPASTGAISLPSSTTFVIVAAQGNWYAYSASPNWLLSQANTWSLPQTMVDTGLGGVVIASGSGGYGSIQLQSDGGSRWIRANDGDFQILDTTDSIVNVNVDPAGNITTSGFVQSLHGYQGFSSNGTFIVPAGVTTIRRIRCWAGGGGGGGSSTNVSNTIAGAGGGGGGYAEYTNYPTEPGNSYFVNVGAGGTPGPNVGGSTAGTGGDSSVAGFLLAVGGQGGSGWNISVSVGGPGGTGSGGTFNSEGAGGGAGADGIGVLGGTGGAAGGGGGGGGGTSTGSPYPGAFPGGGGGGSGNGTSEPGGSGAAGYVDFEW